MGDSGHSPAGDEIGQPQVPAHAGGRTLKAFFRFPGGKAARFQLVHCHVWSSSLHPQYQIAKRTNWRGIAKFSVLPGDRCVLRGGMAVSEDFVMPDTKAALSALHEKRPLQDNPFSY